VADRLADLAACGDVPAALRAIVAARHERSPVRGERQAIHAALVLPLGAEGLTGGGVPQPDGKAGGRRGDLAVRAEGDEVNWPPMGQWVADGPARGHVSPNGEAVLTTHEDGTAQLWGATTGIGLGVPMRHEKQVHIF